MTSFAIAAYSYSLSFDLWLVYEIAIEIGPFFVLRKKRVYEYNNIGIEEAGKKKTELHMDGKGKMRKRECERHFKAQRNHNIRICVLRCFVQAWNLISTHIHSFRFSTNIKCANEESQHSIDPHDIDSDTVKECWNKHVSCFLFWLICNMQSFSFERRRQRKQKDNASYTCSWLAERRIIQRTETNILN